MSTVRQRPWIQFARGESFFVVHGFCSTIHRHMISVVSYDRHGGKLLFQLLKPSLCTFDEGKHFFVPVVQTDDSFPNLLGAEQIPAAIFFVRFIQFFL